MTIDWYLCSECMESTELEDGKHEFNPKCPKCGAKLDYMESYDEIPGTDKCTNRRKDPDKINYSVEASQKIFDAKYSKKQETNVPKCPTCGSTNIERIRTVNRMFSVGIFGLASGKIGKTFKCRNCSYTW